MYEDNKFKGCGLEKTINYTARALEQKCLNWGKNCGNPSGTNLVCREECSQYSSAYYPTNILERCTSANFICGPTGCVICGPTGCYSRECTNTTTAWTGQISIIDYPITDSRQDCETRTERKPYQCATGYCYYIQTYQSCTKVNTYDLTCVPRTAQESLWYGKTVFTNFENCQREHGSFSSIQISNMEGKRSDVGYCTVK